MSRALPLQITMSRVQVKRTFASRLRKCCQPELACISAVCDCNRRHDCSIAKFDSSSAVTYVQAVTAVTYGTSQTHKLTVLLQANLQRKAPAEHAVLQLVRRKTKPNNPQAVLDVIDQFAWNTQWLMNIGDHKGAILDAAIQQYQPKVTWFSATKLHASSFVAQHSTRY